MPEYIKRTEELVLAMNAGARAIENTKRYHGSIYNKDVFSENSKEIPYLLAAKVLRQVSDAPAADVAPVLHGMWVCGDYYDVGDVCSECDWDSQMICPSYRYCPNCGARMDGAE